MCSHPHNGKPTLLRWEDLAGLSRQQQRRKLLERTANSEAGRARFWRKAKVGNPNECWPWLSLVFNDGENYGQVKFGVGSKDQYIVHKFRAHRVAYFLTHGILPDDMCVCHTCDNPICVNPTHLFLGTNRKNIQDRNNKQRDAKGERHGMHKLTEEQVLEIRKIYSSQKISLSALGRAFGISHTHVSFIIKRQSWKHVV